MADYVFDYDYYYFNPFVRLFPYEYYCDGNESSLFECNHSEAIFFGFCIFSEYAGVICQSKWLQGFISDGEVSSDWVFHELSSLSSSC